MTGFTAPDNVHHYMYLSIGGERLLTPEHAWWFWDILDRQGLVPTLFYEGGPRSASDFAALAESPDQRFFFTFKDKRPLGLWWLNGFAPKSCWLHYAFFREAWGRDTIRTGRAVTDYLLNLREQNGCHVFNVIKGQTPATNPLAVRALKLMGFTVAGVMKNGAWLEEEQRSVPAVISCKTRPDDPAISLAAPEPRPVATLAMAA